MLTDPSGFCTIAVESGSSSKLRAERVELGVMLA
jgi:hypothetical protein